MDVWQQLYELLGRDSSILLYRLRQYHPEIGGEMQKFFSKYQGLPSDPNGKLAELQKRGPV